MKVLEQIDNRKFIVEVEDTDFHRDVTASFLHDYFRIQNHDYLYQDNDKNNVKYLEGKNQFVIDGVPYGNTIPCRMQGTLGIREFHKVFELLDFNNHEYLQPEHLVDPTNGKANYTWNEHLMCVWDDCKHSHRYFVREKDKWFEIPRSVYEQLDKDVIYGS